MMIKAVVTTKLRTKGRGLANVFEESPDDNTNFITYD